MYIDRVGSTAGSRPECMLIRIEGPVAASSVRGDRVRSTVCSEQRAQYTGGPVLDCQTYGHGILFTLNPEKIMKSFETLPHSQC